MKTSINHRLKRARERGSIFLVIVITLVVLTIGGITVYEIHKFATRPDFGKVPPAAQDDSRVVVPAGTNDPSLAFINLYHFWEEVNDDGSPLSTPAFSFSGSDDVDTAGASANVSTVTTNTAVCPVVIFNLVSISSNLIGQMMTTDAGMTNRFDLSGMMVNGLPTSWANGSSIGGAAVFELQRSSDLSNWSVAVPRMGISLSNQAMFR
ncbi:MAG: hypothetical protein NTZ38_03015, partial [Candidatus Taylorbacteria bacterium]|nr:hypothetical protein [Candidatus Taylorbacteria bacterium]